MADFVKVRLEPLGRSVEVPRGAPMRDALFAHGVEFPCGGRGKCLRCRVRVTAGDQPAAPEDLRLLGEPAVAEGWRLACHARGVADVTLDIAQWDAAILADDSVFEFVPREGLGIAVDLGTTTLVAQLVHLATGRVLAVRTALNPQAAYGADIMTRVEHAVRDGGQPALERLIRERIGELAAVVTPKGAAVRDVTITGNAVMHHLFCSIDVEPLSHVPFEPVRNGLEQFEAKALGWQLAGNPRVSFLPCLGGFVGSDILAGVLASRMHESSELVGLIDLGTNGEIVFGTRERMVCASAAAGPAFEGGRISTGMRAATGAIAEVSVDNGALRAHVLGGGTARGICGSGLVDAAAAALDLGLLKPNGRLPGGPLALADGVSLTQRDIRELQLAKAAVAAGIRIVLETLGASAGDVEKLYLAGAFGNYVNRASARRIGLIDFPEEKVHPAGNTSLLGAKMALFANSLAYSDVVGRVEHVGLASDARFQEIYVDQMGFPE